MIGISQQLFGYQEHSGLTSNPSPSSCRPKGHKGVFTNQEPEWNYSIVTSESCIIEFSSSFRKFVLDQSQLLSVHNGIQYSLGIVPTGQVLILSPPSLWPNSLV